MTHSASLTISDSNLVFGNSRSSLTSCPFDQPLGSLSRRFYTVFFGSRIGVNHVAIVTVESDLANKLQDTKHHQFVKRACISEV